MRSSQTQKRDNNMTLLVILLTLEQEVQAVLVDLVDLVEPIVSYIKVYSYTIAFEDIFGDMFGGMGGMGRNVVRKMAPIVREFKITLEEIYRGAVKRVAIQKKKNCGTCHGVGGTNPKKCRTCNGSGMQVKTMRLGPMVTQQSTVCSTCQGEGQVIDHKDLCKTCHGRKTVHETKTMDINIPRGMPNEHEIIFRGEGDEDVSSTIIRSNF